MTEEREAIERLEFEAAHRAYGDRMAVNVADVRVLLDRLSTPPSVSAREIAEGIVRHSIVEADEPGVEPTLIDGPSAIERIASAIEEQGREGVRLNNEACNERDRAEAAEAQRDRAIEALNGLLGISLGDIGNVVDLVDPAVDEARAIVEGEPKVAAE